MSDKNSATSAGIGFGVALAISISWSLHKSILWAILHGFFSWLYVIYHHALKPLTSAHTPSARCAEHGEPSSASIRGRNCVASSRR
jgi:hypothetical protein